MTEVLDALHDAVVPPFEPLQLQDQGPPPVTGVAVPALQRFGAVGAVATDVLFADPQVPGVAPVGALHETALLPLPHSQFQVLLVPKTAGVEPSEQSPEVGCVTEVVLAAEPQVTTTGTEHPLTYA